MLSECVMKNEAGWTAEAMAQFRAFDRVLRVDGRGLLPNGLFEEIVVYFATPEEAAAFTQSAAAVLKTKFKIVPI